MSPEMSANNRSPACAAAGETVSSVRKPWISAGSRRCQDRHSRGGQPGGEQVALVAQRIMLGGHDDSGRQPGQVGRVQRADAGVCSQRRVGNPELGPPGDVVGWQAPARPLLGHAGLRHRQVGIRAGKNLGAGHRPALVAQPQAGQGGQVPARAVARDQEGLRGPRQLRLVIEGPADDLADVIDGGRPGMLGSPPEVHRQHGDLRARREPPAEPVMGFQIADRPHAAVQEHHQRMRS